MIYYSISFGYAQNCKNAFIEEVEHTYNESMRKFDKITLKSLKKSQIRSSAEDFFTIHIPVIVGKESKGVKVNKENFLCHLNVKKMEFYETIVLKDSSVIGMVLEFPTSYFDYKFDDDSPLIDLVIKPLVKKLIKIKPDIIFNIYHISDAYWYIKDGDLKVSAFEANNNKVSCLKTFEAEEFIKTLSEEQINSFLHFKKSKVISY